MIYAACICRNGVDTPDPKPEQGGLVIRLADPDAPGLESEAFKAADRNCHLLLGALVAARRP